MFFSYCGREKQPRFFFSQAYKSICDLLVTFADQQLGNTNVALKELEYVPSEEQQHVLNDFVQKYVFTTQQEGKL